MGVREDKLNEALRGPLRVLAVRVAPALLVVTLALRSRRLVNGLQTLIAKGRKNKNRSALVGNYAPVHNELHETGLKVTEGQIPAELRGVYMRNGSNPYFDPYASYHWFEGDGMVHAIRIGGGEGQAPTLTYCNRFMETSRLKQEIKAGRPIFAKFGDQEGVRGLAIVMLEMLKSKTGIIDTSKGDGTANTSIVYHAGKIMALHEGDLPYQIRMLCDGVLETIGRMSVGPQWGETHFTAHPKTDAETGNLHFLGYSIQEPRVKLGTLGPKGDLQGDPLDVELPWTAMMHDMAITTRFKVLLHVPLTFDPKAMVKQNSLPIVFREEWPTRIGLVPHTAKSNDEIKWFELPSFMAFHIANAWEEEDGNVVKLYLCTMNQFTMSSTDFREEMGSRMTEVVMDLRTGKATKRVMTKSVVGDFPIVHPSRQGRFTRYAWTATTDVKDPQARTNGIAKFDLTSKADEACIGRITFPDGHHGGEAFYVPRHEDPAKCDGEDDGFMVVYVYHTSEDSSYFEVYDAKTMASKPLARVRLPQRVPFGFHGTWIPESALKAANRSS